MGRSPSVTSDNSSGSLMQNKSVRWGTTTNNIIENSPNYNTAYNDSILFKKISAKKQNTSSSNGNSICFICTYFFTDLFNSGRYQTNASNTHDKVKKKLDFKENSLIISSP